MPDRTSRQVSSSRTQMHRADCHKWCRFSSGSGEGRHLRDCRHGQRPGIQRSRVRTGQILHEKFPLARGGACIERCDRNIKEDHVVRTAACPVVQYRRGSRWRDQGYAKVPFVSVGDIDRHRQRGDLSRGVHVIDAGDARGVVVRNCFRNIDRREGAADWGWRGERSGCWCRAGCRRRRGSRCRCWRWCRGRRWRWRR